MRFLIGAYFAIVSIPFALGLIIKMQWRPNNFSSGRQNNDYIYTPLDHKINKRSLDRLKKDRQRQESE